MSQSRAYRVEIRWAHRRYGPQRHQLKAEGTSIRRAIGHALLSFFSDTIARPDHRDAHQLLDVRAWRL
jgi:hypothetical protein